MYQGFSRDLRILQRTEEKRGCRMRRLGGLFGGFLHGTVRGR